MKKSKKLLSLVLAVLLCAGMLPTFSLTATANTGETKQIMLGTSGISPWNATDGYDYIYYGIDGESPIKWRVLDTKINTNAEGLFVLSEKLLGTGEHGDVYFDSSSPYSNVFQGSDAQSWCNTFETSNLTEKELEAIIATTKNDGKFTSSTFAVPFPASDNILNGDKVFFLSAEEAENSAYGFVNDSARVANYGENIGCWWLRSTTTYFGSHTGCIVSDGSVSNLDVSGSWAARPAFNLDNSKALFTAETKNAVVSDELSEVSDYSGSGWDITLLDSSRTFNVTETTLSATVGEQVELNHSGAGTGANEYVSAMIVDSSDNVLYYGQIANNSESGTADLTIPSGLAVGSYTLKVFSEQINGDNKTDYASAFEEIPLKVTEAYTITLNYNDSATPNSTMQTDGNGKLSTLPTPTRSGYNFKGWKLQDGTDVTVDTVYTADTEIVAEWKRRSSGVGGTTRYTIKFETDSEDKISSKTVTRNSKLTEPDEPTKDGYVFDGWYTDKKLTEKYDFNMKIIKNYTLYAKWTEADGGYAKDWDKFDDVTREDWFYTTVREIYLLGLMNGVTDTLFAPNDDITRGMFITVLYRAEGEPAVNRSMPFADVKATDYFADAVIWGQQNGIIKGISETEYAPDENITREQMAAILYRYAQYKEYDVSVGESTNILSYTDFDKISEYAVSAMQWACGEGIISGKGNGILDPTGNAARCEAAAMLIRLIN